MSNKVIIKPKYNAQGRVEIEITMDKNSEKELIRLGLTVSTMDTFSNTTAPTQLMVDCGVLLSERVEYTSIEALDNCVQFFQDLLLARQKERKSLETKIITF